MRLFVAGVLALCFLRVEVHAQPPDAALKALYDSHRWSGVPGRTCPVSFVRQAVSRYSGAQHNTTASHHRRRRFCLDNHSLWLHFRFGSAVLTSLLSPLPFFSKRTTAQAP